MRRVLSIGWVLAAGACDGAFDLVRVASHDGGASDVVDDGTIEDDASIEPDADPPLTICFEEHFSDPTLDSQRWTTFGGGEGVVSRISNGVAEISVPSSTGQHPYGGISITRRSLIGTASQMELVVTPENPTSDVTMQLTVDSGNVYYLNVSADKLNIGRISATTPSTVQVTYSSTNHRIVQMRHDTATAEMVFEARGSASPFIELGRMQATVSLTDAFLEIYAGTYDVGPAFVAQIDNVLITGACPQD